MNRKVTENEQQWQMEKGISERVTVCVFVCGVRRTKIISNAICVAFVMLYKNVVILFPKNEEKKPPPKKRKRTINHH